MSDATPDLAAALRERLIERCLCTVGSRIGPCHGCHGTGRILAPSDAALVAEVLALRRRVAELEGRADTLAACARKLAAVLLTAGPEAATSEWMAYRGEVIANLERTLDTLGVSHHGPHEFPGASYTDI